jgi:hypothetical protein
MVELAQHRGRIRRISGARGSPEGECCDSERNPDGEAS